MITPVGFLILQGVVLAVVIPLMWNLGYYSGKVDALAEFYAEADRPEIST
jgi:hypothetical protein